MVGDVKRYVFLVDANRIPFSDESEHGEWVKYEDHIARLTALEQENKRLREALEPSGDTKAAYIGEFWFHIEDRDEDGNECERKVSVPWTTIKEIMAAIRDRAALTHEDKP